MLPNFLCCIFRVAMITPPRRPRDSQPIQTDLLCPDSQWPFVKNTRYTVSHACNMLPNQYFPCYASLSRTFNARFSLPSSVILSYRPLSSLIYPVHNRFSGIPFTVLYKTFCKGRKNDSINLSPYNITTDNDFMQQLANVNAILFLQIQIEG